MLAFAIRQLRQGQQLLGEILAAEWLPNRCSNGLLPSGTGYSVGQLGVLLGINSSAIEWLQQRVGILYIPGYPTPDFCDIAGYPAAVFFSRRDPVAIALGATDTNPVFTTGIILKGSAVPQGPASFHPESCHQISLMQNLSWNALFQSISDPLAQQLMFGRHELRIFLNDVSGRHTSSF